MKNNDQKLRGEIERILQPKNVREAGIAIGMTNLDWAEAKKDLMALIQTRERELAREIFERIEGRRINTPTGWRDINDLTHGKLNALRKEYCGKENGEKNE